MPVARLYAPRNFSVNAFADIPLRSLPSAKSFEYPDILNFAVPQDIAVPTVHHHSEISLPRRIPAIFDESNLLHALPETHPERAFISLMTGVTFHFHDSFSQLPPLLSRYLQVLRSRLRPGK